MTNGSWMRRLGVLAVACVVMVALAACGGSSSSSTGGGGGSTSASAAAASSGSGSGSGSGGLAAAQAGIAPYLGHPGPFPVVDKLRRVPRGDTIAFMDCGTPFCALFYQQLVPAAKLMGVHLDRVNAGSAANTVSAAFDSVVTQKPAAVIVTSISIDLWSRQLAELQKAHIPVVTTGVTGLAPYKVPAPQAAEGYSNFAGTLLADYVAAKFGEKSDAAFYTIPELPFTLVIAKAFSAQIAKVCPACKVRDVPIPVASIGTSAPQTVVSDLQAHPGTTVAVFSVDEAETGLPSALKAAGITVKTIGEAPTPTNLQYIKAGTQTATLGYDNPVSSWALLDQAAREIDHQPLTGDEAKGIMDVEFLTHSSITFNPADGWTGYPDFAMRFATLWGVH